uniref:Lipocalin/cytosolic fatty-acid binding domain-containing protein n=1 Tax=Graphocephala atropunctata TaxID=36148 RepID=A0A1B6M4V5_9HEMI
MRAVVVVATLVELLALVHATIYGPCREVEVVDVDFSKWEEQLYVNMMTKNIGQRCSWVDRHLIYKGNETLLGEHYYRIENGTELNSTVVGTYVSKGYITFTAEKIPNRQTLFHDYSLDRCYGSILFVCTNDPNFDGRGAVFVESPYPTLPKRYAKRTREILEKNGFKIEDLMMVDNCNCRNIPNNDRWGRCRHRSIEEYFSTYH